MLHAPVRESKIDGGRRRSEPMASTEHRLSPIMAYGNQAALRIGVHRAALRPSRTGLLQRKCACGGDSDRATGNGLAISAPGDAFEQEADRVADQVMRMSARQAISGEEEKDLPTAQAVVFRKAQRASASPAPSPPVVPAIAGHGAAGEPLAAAARRQMEGAFGYDFARVRVHRDAAAAAMSRRLGALAFTFGDDIYFGHGMYDPDSAAGGHLLAHELTHVVQQGRADRHGGAAVARTPAPMIQRTATWDDTTPANKANDLVDTVLYHKAAGETWPTLNGTVVKSAADAVAHLNTPTLKFTQVPAAAKGAADEFDATVDTVADNTGSYDETVLKAGPWIRKVPRADVGAALGLAQCAGKGDSTFTARGSGDPKTADTKMADANRRHENHHVDDDKVAFARFIGAWDAKLSAAKKRGTKYHGATQPDATAALYKAMGGTPAEITAQFVTVVSKAGQDFHDKPAGGTVNVTAAGAAKDCSTSWAECTNPS